jgi:hypothetical protein
VNLLLLASAVIYGFLPVAFGIIGANEKDINSGAVCVGVSCESAGVAIVAGLDHGIETVGVQLVDGVSR